MNKFVTKDQVISWGLLNQFEREILIDNQIKDIKKPNDSQLKIIVSEWRECNNLLLQEDLDKYQLLNGLDRTKLIQSI